MQQAIEAESTSTRPRRRRGAFRLEPTSLEANVSNTYEVFQLFDTITVAFDEPQTERDWLSLAAMAKLIVGASNGVVMAIIGCHGDLEELRDALPPGDMRSGLGLERQVTVGSHAVYHGDRLLIPVASLSANTAAVRFQWADWKCFLASHSVDNSEATMPARSQPACSHYGRYTSHQRRLTMWQPAPTVVFFICVWISRSFGKNGATNGQG